VHECYTLQALPPQMLEKTTRAVAGLVAPGGALLIYTRLRDDDAEPQGPPWPLLHKQVLAFANLGLEPVSEDRFEVIRPDRSIPHSFSQWRKPV